jgi:predicted RNA-binding protein YlxR (DUF448 family)
MSRKVRKVPQRTCVACREVRPKRDLTRVVRTPAGEVVVDPSGKQSGRGAYVCATPACVRRALQHGAFERALNVTLTEEDRARIENVVSGGSVYGQSSSV